MKLVTLPIVGTKFIEKLGKTVLTLDYKATGRQIEAWVNGNTSTNPSLFASIRINEVGDTFLAVTDSKRLVDGMITDPNDATKQIAAKVPAYKAGQTVGRLVESVEFLSYGGNNAAAQFGQAADVYGLQLNVIMKQN